MMLRLKAWWWRQTRDYCKSCGRDYRVTRMTSYGYLRHCSRECSNQGLLRYVFDVTGVPIEELREEL